MKYSFLFLFISFQISSVAQQWENAISFKYISQYSNIRHVNDKDGNIYITGEFGPDQKYLEFPGFDYMTKGDLDIFLVKLDSNFLVKWVKVFGNTGKDMVTGIAIDNSGDLLICGYFTDSLTIGKQKLKSKGSSDFFLAKLDLLGDEIWIKSGGSEFADNNNHHSGGIFTDQNNSIYVSGLFADIDDHAPKAIAWFDSLSVKSFGGQDIFVAKYSESGKIIWLKNFGSYSGDFGEISLVGKSIYLTGSADWQFHYDSLSLDNSYGGDIGFVLNMDTSGKIQWVNAGFLTDWGSMFATSVTADSNGNVYVVGMFNCIDLDCKFKFDNFYLEGIGGADIFIAKSDKNGKVKWLKRAGGFANDGPSKIIKKNNNHYIIVGSLTGGGFYEGKKILSGIRSFILDIDSNGNPIFFEPCGTNGNNNCTDISLNYNGKLIVSGNNTGGTLTFDKLALPYLDRPSSLFIAKRDFVQKETDDLKNNIKSSIDFSPNPTDKYLNISHNDINLRHCTLTVCRFDGKITFTKEITSSSTSINTSDWPDGLYLFTFNNLKNRFTKQILIQH